VPKRGLIITASLLILLIPSFLSAEGIKIYDKNWNLIYRIENGKIYDKNWNLKRRIQDNKVYDRNWQLLYRIEDSRICDRNWNLKMHISKGDKIYDKDRRLKGRIKK
jgi:hypothetical protein